MTTPWWNYGEPFETYPIDTGRLRRVTELAAKEAGWGRQLPKGQGLGIAAHRSFVTYVATVVHVVVGDKGKITIPRVDTAIDCGYCVHPERVRSQIEGAAVMGLTLAKYGEVTLKNGAVEQSNFNDFQLARIDESPLETRVHIVAERPRACRRAGWASRACRRSRRRSATPSSPPPASASSSCRSATSWLEPQRLRGGSNPAPTLSAEPQEPASGDPSMDGRRWRRVLARRSMRPASSRARTGGTQ